MSDDYEPVYSLDDVCDKLDNVCDRLDSIEKTLKANHSDLSWVVIVIIAWLALVGWDDLWHSKLRYAWSYNVTSEQVNIEKKPTDCNFFRAPMGGKGCHYDRQVNTVRVKTVYLDFQRGSVNHVSFDEGKTWTVDDANPPTKPLVAVSWVKVED